MHRTEEGAEVCARRRAENLHRQMREAIRNYREEGDEACHEAAEENGAFEAEDLTCREKNSKGKSDVVAENEAVVVNN